MSAQPNQSNNTDRLRRPEEVMGRFDYYDRKAFLHFVHAHGVPHIRINARVLRFENSAIEAWLARRRVGVAA
jgi:predicted DNA-binding transcriptional regulator AlpA